MQIIKMVNGKLIQLPLTKKDILDTIPVNKKDK